MQPLSQFSRHSNRGCKLWTQVGGTLASLKEHMALATAHPLLGERIDYKLAPSQGPRTPQAAQESGFNALSVALCKVFHWNRLACLFLARCALMCLVVCGTAWVLLACVARACRRGAEYRRTCLLGCYRVACFFFFFVLSKSQVSSLAHHPLNIPGRLPPLASAADTWWLLTSVRAHVQEVVSLGGSPLDPGALAAAAAPHVTPQAFHALLASAREGPRRTVLLDVRNLYETRIGLMRAVRTGHGHTPAQCQARAHLARLAQRCLARMHVQRAMC